MSGRVNGPKFDQRVHDKADAHGNYVRDIVERVWLPRIAKRQRAALNVVPDLFRFYQRISHGRLCSCLTAISTSADDTCPVCWGTGTVVGYERYGHRTEIIDATARWTSINVVADYEQPTRPRHLVLDADQTAGFCEALLEVGPNIGKCSLAQIGADRRPGTQITAWVKLLTESEFVPFSADNISARLLNAARQGGLVVRVVMRRPTAGSASPRLGYIRVRVQTLANDIVRADVPRTVQSNRSSEYGFFEDFQTRTFALDDTLRSITTEDFFEQVNTGRRWKLDSVNPNAPGGILTSWDCEAQLVQSSDRFSKVP